MTMDSKKDMKNSANPSFWKDDMHSGWDRVKESMQRDWEQTRHDFGDKSAKDLNQDAPDTLRQAAGSQKIPADGVKTKDADVKGNVSEMKPKHSDAKPYDAKQDYDALRFGYGAAHADQYREEKSWSDGFSVKLRQEWDDLKSGRTWDEVKEAVKNGFEKTRNATRS